MIQASEFIKETSKFFATGRKNGLPVVDAALKTYHDFPTADNARKLSEAIIAWARIKGVKANGDINTTRNPAVIKQLISDVGRVTGGEPAQTLRARAGAVADVGAAARNTASEACKWVKKVQDSLNEFKTYACMDCTNFPQCIRSEVKQEVLNRRLTALNGEGKPPMPTVIQKGQFEWKQYALQQRYNFVQGNKPRQAECTTFGYLAAFLLSHNRPDGPRIELVAHDSGLGSHVYILVGRVGEHTDGRIPNDWDAVVVDGWAASLGHESIYENRRAFEKVLSMSTNLELVMARESSF